MTRKVISTKSAPEAIGPYSQAIAAQGFIFVSGQLGLDPESGELVSGIEEQTRQALTNVNAILEAAQSNISRVVKATVMLSDMDDFGKMNAVYKEFFPQKPPARVTFAVKSLPLSAKVEIDVVALGV
jgi:2-iminobutanoate/2-iminopropanoate deaminase